MNMQMIWNSQVFAVLGEISTFVMQVDDYDYCFRGLIAGL